MDASKILMEQPLVKKYARTYEETYTFTPCKILWYALSSDLEFTYVPDGCEEILIHMIDGIPHCEFLHKDGPIPVRCPGETIYGIRIQPGYFLDCAPVAVEGIMTVILMEVCHYSFMEPGLIMQELYDRLRFLIHSQSGHPAYRSIVSSIMESAGRKTVEEIAAEWGYTERHIYNLFKEANGAGAKSLCRYIRFQNALKGMIDDPNLCNSSYIENLSYSDQAHFQREFKSFAGMTPKQFLKILRS